MSIIYYARDADECLRSDQEDDAWDVADAMGIDFAQAVVRAADLAEELHAQGQRLGNSAYVHERAEGAGYAAAAAQLVATLEGEKE